MIFMAMLFFFMAAGLVAVVARILRGDKSRAAEVYASIFIVAACASVFGGLDILFNFTGWQA
jgi:uncharacterized membrane protein